MRARGFSLIECMVAAALLAAGLLVVAAGHRATQRLTLLGARMAGAANVAASRLSRLYAAPCAAVSDSAAAGPYRERWTVGPGPVRPVSLEVRFVYEGRTRAVRFESRLSCPAP